MEIIDILIYKQNIVKVDHPQQSTLNWVLKLYSYVLIIHITVILNKHQFSSTQHLKKIIKYVSQIISYHYILTKFIYFIMIY